jgi:hypothetical protein
MTELPALPRCVRRLAVAAHEASHAVTAATLGIDVELLHVTEDGQAGECLIAPCDAFKDAIVTLAGVAGELAYLGKVFDLDDELDLSTCDGVRVDVVHAHVKICEHLGDTFSAGFSFLQTEQSAIRLFRGQSSSLSSRRSPDALLRKIAGALDKFLRSPSAAAAVDRLAEQLLVEGEADGDDVRRACWGLGSRELLGLVVEDGLELARTGRTSGRR